MRLGHQGPRSVEAETLHVLKREEGMLSTRWYVCVCQLSGTCGVRLSAVTVTWHHRCVYSCSIMCGMLDCEGLGF